MLNGKIVSRDYQSGGETMTPELFQKLKRYLWVFASPMGAGTWDEHGSFRNPHKGNRRYLYRWDAKPKSDVWRPMEYQEALLIWPIRD